jgi:hypothetical protein
MFDIVLNSPAFVIYVEALSPERKEFFSKNIINAGFTDMQIFPGVNARDDSELNDAMALFPGIKFDQKTRIGQIGCTLSHLKVLKHIIDNKILVSTIFEDDIHFHPQWKEMAPRFFENTPSDFDVIFAGNQIEKPENVPRISKAPCFCMHAYIVTLKGAIKLFNSILDWDFQNFHKFHHECEKTGIMTIDIIIKDLQERMNKKQLEEKFNWYCWNGTKNPCEFNKFPLIGDFRVRNSGLVFQSQQFESIINPEIYFHT